MLHWESQILSGIKRYLLLGHSVPQKFLSTSRIRILSSLQSSKQVIPLSLRIGHILYTKFPFIANIELLE